MGGIFQRLVRQMPPQYKVVSEVGAKAGNGRFPLGEVLGASPELPG